MEFEFTLAPEFISQPEYFLCIGDSLWSDKHRLLIEVPWNDFGDKVREEAQKNNNQIQICYHKFFNFVGIYNFINKVKSFF
jgi:hypothetical protein